MKIYDNFLNNDDFKKFNDIINSDGFPWYYRSFKTKINFEDLNNYQFIHILSLNDNVNSTAYHLLNTFKEKLNIKKIIRAKLNLTTRTSKIYKFPLHRDTGIENAKIAIFYINTNNGYTYFEDKSKIKSIENRLVTFDNSLLHSGTTSTNVKNRIVLNVCYV